MPPNNNLTTASRRLGLPLPGQREALRLAIYNDNREETMRLIRYEHVLDAGGLSALEIACRFGKVAIARAIIKSGICMRSSSSSSPDDPDRSLLQAAAGAAWICPTRCFYELLLLLSECYPGVNILLHQDKNGDNVLHTIARTMTADEGEIEKPGFVTKPLDALFLFLCEVLRAVPENMLEDFVNTRNKKGETPLLLFSAAGSAKAVGVLLQKGAKGNAVDNEGLTAMHFAVGQPYAFERKTLAKLLSLLAPDFGARSGNAGRTLLQEICNSGKNITSQQKRGAWRGVCVSYLSILLATAKVRGCVGAFLVDNRDSVTGDTALMAAVRGRNFEAAKMLLN